MKKLFYNLTTLLIAAMMLVTHNIIPAGAESITNLNTAVTPLAFPGAEGFGANTPGGRGGVVFEVTNLNDSGAGSLRECVEASGARICVFRTGGLIALQSPLRITKPYITIAGQTAPGGGITLKTVSGGDVFLTQTHDVVIRYITVRPGPGGENHANQIAKNGTELYNIIIDHNSLSWGVDSNIETWYRVTNATIQWSIISEGLDCSTHSKGCHSKGLMIGGYKGSESDDSKGSENISILNNLMAHNADRNPLMQLCGVAQVINNTTYNPRWTFAHQQLNCPLGESYVNWINNFHKLGPSSTSNSDLKVIPADNGEWSPGKVYVKGNIGPSRPNDTLPETYWVTLKSGAPSGVIVTTPAPAPTVYSTSALDAYNSVLANAGNSQGVDCGGNWYNRRDTIDARIVNEVKNGTGKIIDAPSQVGGWITPASGTPCADSDHDGMPNVWEIKYGFDPNNNLDAIEDADGDGYTNIEEAINGTNPTGNIVFNDVPSTHWAYSFIETIFYNGITSGCGDENYCPDTPVTRAQMAVFLLRAMHGSDYTPPPASGTMFGDVPNSYWAADWVEQLAKEGITSGCGSGNFCPTVSVTRVQMAVFLLRAEHGSSYFPPVGVGIFNDVPLSYWAVDWVEQLAAEGITSGCGSGNFCPNDTATRAQMAVFLTKTFNLTMP